MQMDDELLEDLRGVLERQAERARENAGYNGARDDGGYADTMTQLAIYQAGYDRLVPAAWEGLARDVAASRDPDVVALRAHAARLGFELKAKTS